MNSLFFLLVLLSVVCLAMAELRGVHDTDAHDGAVGTRSTGSRRLKKMKGKKVWPGVTFAPDVEMHVNERQLYCDLTLLMRSL